MEGQMILEKERVISRSTNPLFVVAWVAGALAKRLRETMIIIIIIKSTETMKIIFLGFLKEVKQFTFDASAETT